MGNIQAIVLDLDGTLLNTSKAVSSRSLRAVKACHDRGVRVIVATARPPRAVRKFLQDIPFVDCTVFYNGALISCASEQMQRHMSIPKNISVQISEFIRVHAPQSYVSYEVNDSWYTSVPVPESQYPHLGIQPTDPKPEVVSHTLIQSLSPTKILILGYNQWQGILERFAEHVNVIATDNGVLIQITHKLASKENGVKWILAGMGVDADDTMVFGDDFNDLGLFQLCGFPVAMANGITELKRLAKFVTLSNDEDGVAVALEKFVL